MRPSMVKKADEMETLKLGFREKVLLLEERLRSQDLSPEEQLLVRGELERLRNRMGERIDTGTKHRGQTA